MGTPPETALLRGARDCPICGADAWLGRPGFVAEDRRFAEQLEQRLRPS
jgi:hypothetical protein